MITQSTLSIPDMDRQGSQLFKGAAIYSSFSLATPLLHLIATTLLFPRYNRTNFIKRICTLPFNGGTRTFIFQFLAWSFWLTSLSIALPLLVHSSSSSSSSISLQYTMGLAGIETLTTIASVGSVFSLLFLLKSILVFEEPSSPAPTSPSSLQPSTPYSTTTYTTHPPPIRFIPRPSLLPSKPVASIMIVAIGLLWATLGSALLFIAADYYASSDHDGDGDNDVRLTKERDTPHSNNNGGKLHYAGIYYALAAAAFATGVFTTHGLAGRLLWEEQERGKAGGAGDSSLSSSLLPSDAVRGRRKNSSNYNNNSTINNNKKKKNKNKNKKKGQPMFSDEQVNDIPSAHAVANLMLGATTASSSSSSGWRFFQPFQGGAFFIATQALGWALFSLALLFIVFLSAQAGKGVVLGLHWWSITATSLAFAAEISLAASLAVYKGQEAIRSHPCLTSRTSLIRAKRAAIMSALFIPTHIFLAIFLTSFILLPAWYALPMWAGSLIVYYGCSGTGVAEYDGSRSWPGFQEWLGKEMDSLIPSWMGSFEIISDWKVDSRDSCGGETVVSLPIEDAHLDQDQSPTASPSTKPQNRKYIFGYAPHALYPIWAGIIPLTQTWRRMFPGITPIPLSASVIFMPPLLRDVAFWVGTRSVSRRSFVRALDERGAVIMVPGGQAELLEAYRMKQRRNNSSNKTTTRGGGECVLVCRHKGFVRLAIQEQASLVPVLVLGELNSLWNLVEWPWLAKRSYKILGFPVPFLIVGKWSILPLPAKTGLRVCVGKPIHPPPSYLLLGDEGDDDVEEQVDQMHRQYYEALAGMFDRHRGDFPGYENVKLVLE